MNRRRKLGLVAALFLVGASLAALAPTAYAFDWTGLEMSSEDLKGDVATAADGFGLVRDLAQLALFAPTESAQNALLDNAIHLLEGTGGPDVRADGIPASAVFVHAEWLLSPPCLSDLFPGPWPNLVAWPDLAHDQVPETALYVVAGGAVGAATATQHLQAFTGFIRQNQALLSAHYALTYGTGGSTVLAARISTIELLQSDTAEVARFALADALDARAATDPQTRRERLLHVYAESAAIAGMEPTPESQDRSSSPAFNVEYAWVNDSVSLAGDLYRSVEQLRTDMAVAAAAATP